MDIKKKLGNKIRQIRQDNSISQEKLAAKCKLHRTYISAVERGLKNVSIENIEKIALALDITVSDLLKNGL